MPREEGEIVRGRSRSRSPAGPLKHAKHDDRRITDARGDSRKQERRRSSSRSRSRGGERRRSRSRSRDRDHYKSRRRSTSRSPRERSHRHERRRSRTRSIERSRSRDRDRKHRKKRDRSPSSESDTDSDEEYRRRRKERKKEKESKRSKSKERRKEKKREKKEKKKQAGASHWGKYGIINEGDIFTKSSEFHTWLVEERKINPETISKDQNKKEFSKFVEDYNTATLPHEKYYNMEAYERRMDALRSGELLPPTDDNYDPQADMKALKSAHKRKTVEHDSYLSKEQLQELRKVQQERVEASKMKLLGMDVKQTMGVRMDGVGFD